MIKKNGILYFDNLSQFPHIVHGFSTRIFGDMRPIHSESASSLHNFSKALNIDPQKFVRMHQVHGKNVGWVDEDDRSHKIEETDALMTGDSDVFLSVVTADCVPLLLYDKKKEYLGAMHAGWRGLYKEIVSQAISDMFEKGSNPDDIIVGIGPSIGVCCYEIKKEHAEMFAVKFSQWDDFVIDREGKLFLNLSLLVKYQLRSLGILDTNIEDAKICTADSPELYSCRREGEGFGEFVGIIGIRD